MVNVALGLGADEVIIFSLIINQSAASQFSQKRAILDINISEISQSFKHNVRQDSLKKTLSALATRRILIKSKCNSKSFTSIPIFAELSYNGQQVKAEINYLSLPYITETYTNYKCGLLKYILQLNSIYAVKLYQLFNQDGSEITIDIGELKKYLGVVGAYTRYSSFKYHVILSSLKEINQKTDLYVEFNEVKNSQKIIKLEFFINKNT